MFKFLTQPSYKDDNGNPFSADKVDCLAPYKYVIDGFYTWECGHCNNSESNRSCGWPIAGQVLKCSACQKMNLLVKTNCVELDHAFSLQNKHEEREKELLRLQNIESELNSLKSQIKDGVQSQINQLTTKIVEKALKEL
jgi:hypothetical protein